MARQARDTSKIIDCGKPMIIGTRACALLRHARHIPIAGRSKGRRPKDIFIVALLWCGWRRWVVSLAEAAQESTELIGHSVMPAAPERFHPMRVTCGLLPGAAAAPPGRALGLDPVGLARSPVPGPKADGRITRASVRDRRSPGLAGH